MRADAIYTGPTSKAEKKRREGQQTSKGDPVSISRLAHACSKQQLSFSSLIPRHMSLLNLGGRTSTHYLASMGAPAAIIGRSHKSYTSIASYVVASRSLTSKK